MANGGDKERSGGNERLGSEMISEQLKSDSRILDQSKVRRVEGEDRRSLCMEQMVGDLAVVSRLGLW